ncbi:hypothetical protein ACQKEY_13325 [Lysinibacillus fusiformis]|uniref:hypothetical protein n=1 Tax=Lysinibacillus fusiformis TaxID=28031 RepID=UPI003D081670
MIELTFNDTIITNHKNLIFGNNKEKDARLYQKLKKITKDEKQIIIKRIFRWVFDNLEDLIMGNLEILDIVVLEFEKMIKVLSREDKKYILNKLDIFIKEYDYFKNASEWNAYKYLKELKVIICPYCNSQFTYVYESSEGRTRANLDHFFDKATYPFLAISLYNLVPSCKVCNSDLKHKKTVSLKTHYSPFEVEIEKRIKLKRKIVPPEELISINSEGLEDYVATILGVNEDFNIIFEYDEYEEYYGQKIKGNIELFHLDKLYNEFHKVYVQDIIKKGLIYNQVYLQQLAYSSTLIFKDEIELHNSLFSDSTDDKKKILGKLTRDIIEDELGKHRDV